MTNIEKLNKIQGCFMLNRSQLADLIGVNRSQITRWFDNKAQPTAENVDKINELYKKLCPIDSSA